MPPERRAGEVAWRAKNLIKSQYALAPFPGSAVAMDNSSNPARGQQLLVFRPQQLVDAQVLIQAVKGNQAVVLDASSADDGEAQLLIDFACGGMEAIDGQVHRIDAETFLFSPAQGRVEHWPLSA
jgi:FtsZ-interacting cell division protein YlmF